MSSGMTYAVSCLAGHADVKGKNHWPCLERWLPFAPRSSTSQRGMARTGNPRAIRRYRRASIQDHPYLMHDPSHQVVRECGRDARSRLSSQREKARWCLSSRLYSPGPSMDDALLLDLVHPMPAPIRKLETPSAQCAPRYTDWSWILPTEPASSDGRHPGGDESRFSVERDGDI